MIEKLRLPFPLLSDPDRTQAIIPYGLADEKDPRNLARPAVVIVAPDGAERYRAVSRDFADRLSEDALLEALRGLSLPATAQDPPLLGASRPGPAAMPVDHLYPYFRGARFAVVAMSRRHPDTKEDAAGYIAEMDRYMENAKRLFKESKNRT
jgi:hypothetical protein